MNKNQYQLITWPKLSHWIASCIFLCCVMGSGWAAQSDINSTSNIELLMIDSDDCPYCRKFDREIAAIYPKTNEGKRAPLARHHLGDPLPTKYAALDITRNTMTPTFILVKDNQEVDRLVGYNGDEFFWFLLNDLLNKLPEN